MTNQEFELFKQLATKFEAHFSDNLVVNLEYRESDGSVIDVFSLTELTENLVGLSEHIYCD